LTGTLCVAVCGSVLQCVAVCCSVLQCVAVCCRVLQSVAVLLHVDHWNLHIDGDYNGVDSFFWYSVAVCCSVLQCVAVCCYYWDVRMDCDNT